MKAQTDDSILVDLANNTCSIPLSMPEAQLPEIDFQPQIDALIETFDFESVRKTMVALDWKYGPTGTVPDVPELKEAARQILNSASEEDNDLESFSGGFVAWRSGNDLYLRFVVGTAYAGPEGARKLLSRW